MKIKHSKNQSANFTLIIKTAIITLVTIIAFIFLFSVFMFLSKRGYEYATVFATLSLAAGAFAGSVFLSNLIGNKGLLIGLLVGSVIFVLVTLISLIVDKGAITTNTLFHLIIIILSSTIGGIIGVNKAHNKKYI